MPIRIKLLLAVGSYWAIFALITLMSARRPGLMLDPGPWTYPWVSVFAVWAIVAAMLAGIYLVLWPKSPSHVLRRIRWGFFYSAAVAFAGLLSNVTDMPGHFYVPMYASLLLFIIQLVAAAMVRDKRVTHE